MISIKIITYLDSLVREILITKVAAGSLYAGRLNKLL